jgi:hypothetical protein
MSVYTDLNPFNFIHILFAVFPLVKSMCWGDPDVDGWIILRWIFRKLEGSWGLEGVGSG